jgi:hypothetical protein
MSTVQLQFFPNSLTKSYFIAAQHYLTNRHIQPQLLYQPARQSPADKTFGMAGFAQKILLFRWQSSPASSAVRNTDPVVAW